MSLEPGRTLLHYRIVEKLGEGGMGQVWRAIDTSLDRPVAIKVLPDAFVGDAERLARFEQEARLLASLNHPNIASVYSVHAHDGVRFLAMEFVEGEDLARVLARGALGAQDALEIAVQIAQALEAAHDSGVVHRDLKPANVAITPAGKVKVLDFGLAKALGAAGGESDPSLSPTMTSARTAAGVILGTASYMSPEQARGRAVDRRADVWAFGCVLYEMLTGRRAFEGETVTDTLAAVLKTEPDWSAVPAETPPAVRRVLRRCLTRDAGKRLGHVSGALVTLQETLDGALDGEPTTATRAVVSDSPPWKRVLPWALVALLAVVAVLALWPRAPRAEPAELLSLIAPFPAGPVLPQDQMGIVALSPDGKNLAAVLRQEGEQQLYLRRMDGDEMVPLAGTIGAATPVFSPDGKWIAFFADQKLKKISVEGGKPITLCNANGSADNRGASWGTDDRIVFAGHYTQALSRVAGAGGAVEALTKLDAAASERSHRWPQAIAEHDVALFTVGVMESPESYDGSRIDAVRLSTGERKTVLEGASMARYLPTGHLVFGRDGFLFAVPFDVERLETRGNPVPVVENVMGMSSSGVVHADFSTTGLLAYIAGSPRSRRLRLVWRDREGRIEPLPAPPAGYMTPRLSPDRTRIVAPISGDGTFDIWVWDIARAISTRLTFEGDNTDPVWSTDGTRIIYGSVRAGSPMLTYTKPADGSGVEERLYAPPPEWSLTAPAALSPDGRTLLFEFKDAQQSNIMALEPLSGEARVLLHSPAAEGEPTLSPDGRWLAYSSDESGTPEIYVRRFPGLEGRWQISDGGGINPRWSPDSREMYYRWRGSLFAVSVRASDERFEADRPQKLFDGISVSDNFLQGYDVLDRERFLFAELAEEAETAGGVTIVVNWLDELRRRVPP